MSESTEITSEIDEIKILDKIACQEVDDAKAGIKYALKAARKVAFELNALESQVGARKFALIIQANFDEGFKSRVKSYRKTLKADPRQSMLSLELLPPASSENTPALVKVQPFFSWVNKVTGYLRKAHAPLPQAEIIVLKALIKEIDRIKEEGKALDEVVEKC
tara:strand:- start:116 stop:604 length:489 start_codon:yes stop_codon:yes gene_type:complete